MVKSLHLHHASGLGILAGIIAEQDVDRLLAAMRAHPLDDEVLFDCDLSSQREPLGRANRST